MGRPLEGVRVVEAAQMISAPLAAAMLADQGADVVKVELANGRGDRMRPLGDIRNGMGSVFHECNRGKRSVTLDTKDERGRDALRRLVASADVFIQNFRPGAVERMGVGPDEARRGNPRLVYVSVSGFGPTGPYADQMVYDFVIQGLTGFAAHQGLGGPPELIKTLVVDKVTALTACQAVTAALFERERTGGGQHVEVNMLDAGLAFFWPDGMWSDTLQGEGITRTPPMALNYDVRPTKDGYITLNLATNSTWPRLCAAIDPALADDPRFGTYEDRQRHAAALAEAVDAVLASRTTDEVLAQMRANDLPGGPVLAIDRIHEDPQVRHNEALVEQVSETIGALRRARPPARFHGRSGEPAGDAPALGAHTREVLAELGYPPDDIDDLARSGILGPTA